VRYINPERIERAVTADWMRRAHAALDDLRSARNALERAQIYKDHGGLWSELKPRLASISDNKCWYCESRLDRSDGAVDHFRPKGRIANEKDHPGYWWLAFVHGNYRLACTFCNSRRIDVEFATAGGKQDHFPLEPTGVRAWAEGDDLDDERPLLLDPCQSGDARLLTFDETGQTSHAARAESGVHDAARVAESTNLYHWTQTGLLANRRLIMSRVNMVCSSADALYVDADQPGRKGWDRMIEALVRMADAGSDHSAVAFAALRSLRTSSISAREALARSHP
jgi:hypothetical protein